MNLFSFFFTNKVFEYKNNIHGKNKKLRHIKITKYDPA
jgi:hypothetical protein